MVLSQYLIVGTTWYGVVQGQNRAFRPVYIEKVEIWLGVTDVLLTDNRQNIVALRF